MGNNKVFLIDRLLAIPLAVYFWWYGLMQKVGKRRKRNPINAADNSVQSRGE